MDDDIAVFLRIAGDDGAGGLTLENPAGDLFPVPRDVASSQVLASGDVLRVDGGAWTKVSPENWVLRDRVGIVREITSDGAAVEVGLDVVAARNKTGLELQPKNTVRLNARNEILEIVSADPIRRLPIEIDRSDDAFDPTVFIQSSSGGLNWDDFGGFGDIVEEAKEIVGVHLDKRSQFAELGATPLRGVIFEGPPGTGKTFMARIMAEKAGADLYVVGAAELGGHLVGESEGRLQAIYDHAAGKELSIVFIDELDSISHHRGADSANHADRLVSTFLVNMDGFLAKNNILTIGTTNRIEAVDTALRRSGRFGHEITFRHPELYDRLAVLEAGARRHRTSGELSHELVAGATNGWTAAALDEVWTAAATLSILHGHMKITDEYYVMGMERVALRHSRKRALA